MSDKDESVYRQKTCINLKTGTLYFSHRKMAGLNHYIVYELSKTGLFQVAEIHAHNGREAVVRFLLRYDNEPNVETYDEYKKYQIPKIPLNEENQLE